MHLLDVMATTATACVRSVYKAGCKPSMQSNGFITEDIGGRISICDNANRFRNT